MLSRPSQAPSATPAHLAALAVGQRARVCQLHGESALIERLLEQGLTVGTEVQLLQRGRWQGHVQLGLRGYVLSLGAAVAACIEVVAL